MDNFTEISRKYNNNSFIRSVVSLIPHIGGGLDILLTDKWNKYYQRRVENMLQQLSSDIKTVEDKIDEEYLTTEEFLDLITKVLNEARQTRLDEKRKLYSKVIRDSISNRKKTSDTESIIEIISNLYENDFFFLNRINEFTQVAIDQKEQFTADGISTYNPTDYTDINEIIRVLYRFSYLGLLDYEANKLTTRDRVKFSKTPLFIQISEYLKE